MARAVLHAAIDLETASQVKEVAENNGKSESAIVQEALNRYLSDLAADEAPAPGVDPRAAILRVYHHTLGEREARSAPTKAR